MPHSTKLPIPARTASLHLETRNFRQSRAMCGPACLRIVFSYFGRSVSERAIAEACRSSSMTGTTGSNLARGAARFGFTAHVVDGSTFRHIALWLGRRVPTIVDWMSAIASHPSRSAMPCGHYSVVCGLDRKYLYLQDPAIGRRRRVLRRDFLNLWFDFTRVRPSRKDLIVRRLIIVTPIGSCANVDPNVRISP